MLNSWLESSFQHLSSSIKQGRVPHSIIISGDNTLGGASLALEIAKLILCENRQGDKCCDNCKSCLLFNNLQQGSHPDFLSVLSATTEQVDNGADLSHNFKYLLSDMGTPLLEESVTPVKGNKSIKVESIRRLCEWIVEGSILGNGKVCVVSNAQLMNEASSNALLKTFEEPPKDSCIILLTSTFDALPATILSRALKIQLPSVEERVGIDYLSKELKDNFNQDRARVCLELAKSSPIGALQYYNEQLDLIATEILQGLNDAIENKVDLIITHHPIIFRPMKNFLKGNLAFDLAVSGISAISAHTSFDCANGGVNDVLCELLGIKNAIIGIESNKKDAVLLLNERAKNNKNILIKKRQ